MKSGKLYNLCIKQKKLLKTIQQYNKFNKVIKQNGSIFMDSENSKTSDPYRLLLNLLDKINLKRCDKYVALWNLSIYDTWKNMKMSCKNNKFKI